MTFKSLEERDAWLSRYGKPFKLQKGAQKSRSRAKLTWEQVREIRATVKTEVDVEEASDRYNLSVCAIRSVINGATWREHTDPLHVKVVKRLRGER